MSLTLSATFSNSTAAARAVRLLRQAGISAVRTGRPAPMEPPQPAAFDESGFYLGTNAVTVPRTLSLVSSVPERPVPARCDLAVSADPADLMRAREIVYRCGGVLR